MKKLKFQYLQPENIHPNDGIRERYPHFSNYGISSALSRKKFASNENRS